MNKIYILLTIAFFTLFLIPLVKSQETVTYTPSSETHCKNGKCTLTLYSGTFFTKEPDGNYYTLPEVSEVRWQNNGFNFSYRDYWVLIEPLVIYNGNTYTIQQIKQAFLNVNLKDHVSFSRFSHKFAVNITAPQNLINNTDYVVLHLKDSHGLTWNDIEKTNQSIIIKDKVVISYADLLESHFTLNLVNKTYLLIGNISVNSQNGFIWLDPTIQLQDADTENLDDARLRQDDPDDNWPTGTLQWGESSTSGEVYWSYIKFNISAIPSGQTVDDATLALWIHFNAYDTGETATTWVYELANYTWTEEAMTWNSRATSAGALIDTNDTIDGDMIDFWLYHDVTSWISSEYSAGKLNTSLLLNATLEYGTYDRLGCCPKEAQSFGDCSASYPERRLYLNITYSAVAGQAYGRTGTDSLSTSDTNLKSLGKKRTQTDSFSLSETKLESIGKKRTETDSLTVSDSREEQYSGLRTLSDSLTPSDTSLKSKGIWQTLSDSLTLSDTTTKLKGLWKTLTDSLTFASSPVRKLALYRIKTDSFLFSESYTKLRSMFKTLTDYLGFTETQTSKKTAGGIAYTRTLSDYLTLSDTTKKLKGLLRTLSDYLSFTELREWFITRVSGGGGAGGYREITTTTTTIPLEEKIREIREKAALQTGGIVVAFTFSIIAIQKYREHKKKKRKKKPKREIKSKDYTLPNEL